MALGLNSSTLVPASTNGITVDRANKFISKEHINKSTKLKETFFGKLLVDAHGLVKELSR